MVDTTGGLQFRIPAVKGTVLGKAELSLLKAVVQYTRLCKDTINLVSLINIKITCQHHGLTLSNLFDTLHHQFGTLAACHSTYVVHVQIKVIELQAGTLEFKITPRADTHTSGIPTQTRLLRGFRQPEVAMIQQFDFVTVVEDV